MKSCRPAKQHRACLKLWRSSTRYVDVGMASKGIGGIDMVMVGKSREQHLDMHVHAEVLLRNLEQVENHETRTSQVHKDMSCKM